MRLRETTDDYNTNRTIQLNGASYKLEFEILRGSSTRFTIKVPFPSGYPDTEITKKLGEFTLLNLDYFSGINTMHIAIFYTANRYKNVLLEEEATAIDRLGPQMLCTMIHYMYSNDFIKNQETCKVSLDAEGSYERMIRTKTYDEDEMHNFFLRHRATYTHVLYLKSTGVPLPEAKQTTVQEGVYNLKLVEYYKRNYGFEVVDDSNARSVKMETSLATVLKHCQDVSNFRLDTEQVSAKKRLAPVCTQCEWTPAQLMTVDGALRYCSYNCAMIHCVLTGFRQ